MNRLILNSNPHLIMIRDFIKRSKFYNYIFLFLIIAAIVSVYMMINDLTLMSLDI